jgi:flagellar assembly protein FliH
LRKIIKSSNTEQVNTFRLHYFPSIPVPHKGNDGAAQGSGAPLSGKAASSGMASRGSTPLSAEDQLRLKEEEIEHQAYERGFRKGEEEGRMTARENALPLFKNLETVLAELDGIRSRIQQQLEREVVELALHVARKVIHHELSVSDDAILGVVKEAMAHLDHPGKISIRLNPEDLKRLRESGERLHTSFENLDNIAFETDPGIECGGCFIHTDYGEIDARLEEQLRHIEDAFRTEMRNGIAEDG